MAIYYQYFELAMRPAQQVRRRASTGTGEGGTTNTNRENTISSIARPASIPMSPANVTVLPDYFALARSVAAATPPPQPSSVKSAKDEIILRDPSRDSASPQQLEDTSQLTQEHALSFPLPFRLGHLKLGQGICMYEESMGDDTTSGGTSSPSPPFCYPACSPSLISPAAHTALVAPAPAPSPSPSSSKETALAIREKHKHHHLPLSGPQRSHSSPVGGTIQSSTNLVRYTIWDRERDQVRTFYCKY